VSLYLRTDTPTGTAVMLGRYNRRDGNWYTWNKATTGEDGKRNFDGRIHPSDATAGKLQIVRRGTTVTFLVADAGRDAFVPLGQCDLGPEDVNLLRLAAENGKSDSPLDVRFGELDIRSVETVAKDGTPATASDRRPGPTRHWLVGAEILLLFLVVTALAVWRRRRTAVAPTPSDVGFACPHCERKLWAKGQSIGKTFKCPGCGRPVTVHPPPHPTTATRRGWLRVTTIGGLAVAALTAAWLLFGPTVAGRSTSPDAGSLQAAAERVRSLDSDTIDLRSTPDIADNDLAALRGLPNLKHLILDYCPITDAGLRHVGRAPSLLSLSLTRTDVTDAGLAELSGVIGLEELRLDETAITDAGLVHVATFPQLRSLSLYRTGVTDAGLASLTGLYFLERLSLDETRVTNRGLRGLARFPYLNELKVWKTHVTPAGIEALQKALPKLRVVQ
jgi:hypothetical protein